MFDDAIFCGGVATVSPFLREMTRGRSAESIYRDKRRRYSTAFFE